MIPKPNNLQHHRACAKPRRPTARLAIFGRLEILLGQLLAQRDDRVLDRARVRCGLLSGRRDRGSKAASPSAW
jgi:hypothetical protein